MARTSNKYRTKHRNHQNSSLYGPLTSASASSSKRVPVKAAAAAHHFHKKRHSQPRDINAHSHFLGTRKRHDCDTTRIITTTTAGAVKQIPFSLRLPPLNTRSSSSSTNSKDMPPWYQTTTTTTKFEDGHMHTTKKSCCSGVSILQHLHSSHDGLQRLDEELRLFARYVSLTPIECRARDYVISHIDKTCRDLFSPRRRRRETENDETDEHEIAVQAFGSYATTTKQVCTFASDVDLALWGVVPTTTTSTTTENQEGTHTRFVQHETPNDAVALHSTYPLDKEDRVQKWKEALAELDAQETSHDDDERDLVVEHPPSLASSSSVATKNGDSSGMMMVEVVAAKNDGAADADTRNDDESVVVDHGGLSQESPPSTIVNVSQQRGATTTTTSSSTTGANAATTTNDDDGGATTRIEVVVAKTDDDDTLLAVAETNAAPVVEIAPAVAKNLNVTTTTKEQSLTEDDPPPPNANEQDSLLFVIDRVGDEAAADAVVPEPDTHQSEPLLPETIESKPNKPEAQLKSTKQQATTTTVVVQENETHSKSSFAEGSDGAHAPSVDDVDAQQVVLADDDGGSAAAAPLLEQFHHDGSGESDADSADKLLESYASRVATRHCNDNDDDSDEQEGPFVSLSDSEQDDDFQVSFVVSQRAAPPVSSSTTTAASVMVGPQGETRKLVLGALKRLGRQLWKSPVIHTVEVRKHARVPIIATGTHLGFESDIALGGHNGTDTSQYASTQAERFKSFAPVVLFLKVLLGQQKLDKPFTGGLGSYKLYVLVAHHLEEHLALGGVDRPSEVLLTFFYRFRKFRDKRSNHNSKSSLETLLSQSKTIHCDKGSADLQPVFKLIHCCDLFNQSWTRLMQALESNNSTTSLLGKLIHCNLLRSERDLHRNKASKLDLYLSKLEKWPGQPSFTGKKRSIEDTVVAGDADANTLLAGYGMKRGPRGGLIPRNRPDVAASDGSRIPEAVARATKNRKNKKKQTRDEGLKAIAQDHIKMGSAPPKKKQRTNGNGFNKSKKQKQQAAKGKNPKNAPKTTAGAKNSKSVSKKGRNGKRK